MNASMTERTRLQIPLLLLLGSCGAGHHCGQRAGVVSIASADATGFSGVAGLAAMAEGLESQAPSTLAPVLPPVCVLVFTNLGV